MGIVQFNTTLVRVK